MIPNGNILKFANFKNIHFIHTLVDSDGILQIANIQLTYKFLSIMN